MKRVTTRQKFLQSRLERRKGAARDAQSRRFGRIDDETELANRLLAQDDTIPGNRNSGFRFNHLLFIMLITPIYLWYEIAFGSHLLDTISSNPTQEETDVIEHWGRIISGVAVSLLFLTGWFRHCEKRNLAWLVRIGVSVAIAAVCIPLTWLAQGKVIEFYVKRGTTEIAMDLGALFVAVVIGFLVLRAWLRYCIDEQKHGPAITVAGLVVILAAGTAILSSTTFWLNSFQEKIGLAPVMARQLGHERQQAAGVSVIKRGIQEGIYTLKSTEFNQRDAASPEGKALLALFPVIGSVQDQGAYSADVTMVIRELMYRDWDKAYGGTSYAAFVDQVKDLEVIHAGPYASGSAAFAKNRDRARAKKVWDEHISNTLAGESPPPGLSLSEFQQHRAVRNYLRKSLACFDCEFFAGMTRDEFGRELFKWTQAHNVERTLANFASPEYFMDGRDGENAARTYWVPIWALLFSMVGAFTHLFKMLFTTAEYFQRMSFHRVHAADSLLADEVVKNSFFMVALGISLITLFIFVFENRVTGGTAYKQARTLLWQRHPVVGAVAAHWTINAQGILYPVTRKLRPDWLKFKEDPLDTIPFVKKLVKNDQYE